MFHQAEHSGQSLLAATLPLFTLFGLLFVFYTACMVFGRRSWPGYKLALWGSGTISGGAGIWLSQYGHADFRMHMAGHLLLGMLAPLLLLSASPVTLLLRTVPVSIARDISRLLKSKVIWVLGNPFLGAILNIGGLWLIYTTGLYSKMHQNIFLFFLVHLHVFLAGCLFTAVFIEPGPIVHPSSFRLRSVVLIAALAGHGILSKYVYNQPPPGVPLDQGQAGGMLMYYGGDAVDLLLITMFCYQWFQADRPRRQASDRKQDASN